MEASDVKNIISSYLAEHDNYNMFDHLFQQYMSEREEGKDSNSTAIELWEYMKSSAYIPQHLNSDEDMALARMLTNLSAKEEDPDPLVYAVIILHNRFILSNILERAITSLQIMDILIRRDNLLDVIIDVFYKDVFSDSNENRIYREPFEENDASPEAIRTECMRAVLPYVLWLHEYAPYILESRGIRIDFLKHLEELIKKVKHQKKALPKFSAVGRYLYDILHKSKP